jgi:Tfp pilus assembly protein PilN
VREMEFIPAWYPTLRRRRRLVIINAWIAAGFVVALGGWMLLAERNIRGAQASLDLLHGELKQTDTQLQRLSELQSLNQQMQQQAQVVARLGPHVPTARIVNILEDVMPPEMALLDFSSQQETQVKAQTAVAIAAGMQAPVVHRVRFRIHGVSPTDVDLGDFLARLAAIPYFSDINMTYSRDRSDSGHMMREFEVTFELTLDGENS